MNLDQAQLHKRGKELDAQQEYLDAQRKILENAPISLSVYEATVKAKTTQLETMKIEIDKANSELNKINLAINAAQRKAEINISYRNTETKEANEKLSALKNSIIAAAKELKIIKDESKELKRYYEIQDEQVTIYVREGNDKLLELKNEVASLQNEINLLTRERTALKAEVDDLIVETDTLGSNYDAAREKLDDEKKGFELKIIEAKKEYTDEMMKFKVIDTEVINKLAILKEKESSIIAKRDALTLERQELEEDKRRWNSKKSLYSEDLL